MAYITKSYRCLAEPTSEQPITPPPATKDSQLSASLDTYNPNNHGSLQPAWQKMKYASDRCITPMRP